MEQTMTAREFSSMCKDRGFIHKKKSFYRCIGDGVYQTIYTGDSCFIDTSSPWYSSTHRRSNYISIGIYSVYSSLPEYWFNPSYGKGEIDPENIVGKRDQHFQGIQEHYHIMESAGFDFLDSITSQRKMIEAIERICEAQQVNALSRSSVMCIPYLLCGEKEKALCVVNAALENPHFMEWCTTTWEGDPKAEDKKAGLQEYLDLQEAIYSKEKLQILINKYYLQNLEYADRYGIPIFEKFTPMSAGTVIAKKKR